jgi:outer membrane protein assembly factor BamB
VLEEPYRWTLVQRYFHDLTPQEIAERSGASPNTVKARLARGLEKLRVELDRRYGGRRDSWCHWLVLSAAKPLPIERTGPATSAAPRAATPASWPAPASTGSATFLGGWVLVATLIVVGLTWIVWRSTRDLPRSSLETLEVAHAAPSGDIAPLPRAPTHRPEPAETPAETVLDTLEIEPEPPAILPPSPFQWPQLAGVASHAPVELLAGREQRIACPRVASMYGGLSGQPTIDGMELYSGGTQLARLDLTTGVLRGSMGEVLKRIQKVPRRFHNDEEDWEAALASQGLTIWATVAGAPVIAGDLVVARMVGDGSVSGFDRNLELEQWRWEPDHPEPSPLSGLMVDDLYLLAHGTEVVALRVLNGSVEWRFSTGDAGPVRMVPACSEDLLFFATELGVVFAVDVNRGREVWRVRTDRRYAWAHPVALGDRVILADAGPAEGRGSGEVRAFQSYDGRELWKAYVGQSPCSTPGVGAGFVAVGSLEGVDLFSLENGEPRGSVSVPRPQVPVSPTVMGEELTFGGRDGELHVLRIDGRIESRWTFRARQILDLVPTGDRLYVVVPEGLVCLADDPGAEPVGPDFVLEWDAEEARATEREQKRLREEMRKLQERTRPR